MIQKTDSAAESVRNLDHSDASETAGRAQILRLNFDDLTSDSEPDTAVSGRNMELPLAEIAYLLRRSAGICASLA